jgi:hypothetical protein
MEKKLLQDVPLKERIETLESSADKVENFSYTKPFTPDQILVFKDELSTTMIELDVIEDEFKEIKDEYKDKMKPLEQQTKSLLTKIKNKAEFLTEKCYVMVEGKEVGYYNSAGELIYQRPLLPGEQQKTIFSVKREGTND